MNITHPEDEGCGKYYDNCLNCGRLCEVRALDMDCFCKECQLEALAEIEREIHEEGRGAHE